MFGLLRNGFTCAAGGIILLGCAGIGIGPSDIELTWQKSRVAVPWRDDTVAVDALMTGDTAIDSSATQTYPVILYLHGCTGIGSEELDFGRSLAEAGFIFIAPDSMARRFRPLQCDPKSQTGGHNLFVFDFRLAEISYALQQIKQINHIDRERMYLVGGSEGGVAAALYRGNDFSRRVIFQWTCRGADLVAGIDAPPNEPILAIVNRDDPWYAESRTRGQSGDCGSFLEDRPGSQSVVIDRPGIHNVLDLPSVRMAIMRFLRDE